MLHALHPHPEFATFAVYGIYVQLERRARALVIDYVVRGQIDELLIPAPSVARAVHELWRHTCCEAFLAPAESNAYFEFNFSPSSEWAVYRFDSYRAGMRPIETIVPIINTHRREDELEVTATIDLENSELDRRPLRIGLAAVIEERIGRQSYWALTHAAGKPDFHHVDGFAIDFPAS